MPTDITFTGFTYLPNTGEADPADLSTATANDPGTSFIVTIPTLIGMGSNGVASGSYAKPNSAAVIASQTTGTPVFRLFEVVESGVRDTTAPAIPFTVTDVSTGAVDEDGLLVSTAFKLDPVSPIRAGKYTKVEHTFSLPADVAVIPEIGGGS